MDFYVERRRKREEDRKQEGERRREGNQDSVPYQLPYLLVLKKRREKGTMTKFCCFPLSKIVRSGRGDTSYNMYILHAHTHNIIFFLLLLLLGLYA